MKSNKRQLALAMQPRRLPAECDGRTHYDDPCPFVSCRYHMLMTGANGTGGYGGSMIHSAAVAVSGDDFDNWTPEQTEAAIRALPESCAILAAEDGPLTTRECAEIVGVSQARVVVLESDAAEILQSRLRQLGVTTCFG